MGEETSQAIQHYVFGTQIITADSIDPFVGNIDTGGPPVYSTYAYPTGAWRFPRDYPVPPPYKMPQTPWQRVAPRPDLLLMLPSLPQSYDQSVTVGDPSAGAHALQHRPPIG